MRCLFVQKRYHLKKGTRDEFYRRFRDNNIREFSQAEEGNIEYEIFMPLDNESDICLFEKWQDEAAEKKHTQTLHYAILSELKTKYVKKSIVQKFWLNEYEPDINVKF